MFSAGLKGLNVGGEHLSRLWCCSLVAQLRSGLVSYCRKDREKSMNIQLKYTKDISFQIV